MDGLGGVVGKALDQDVVGNGLPDVACALGRVGRAGANPVGIAVGVVGSANDEVGRDDGGEAGSREEESGLEEHGGGGCSGGRLVEDRRDDRDVCLVDQGKSIREKEQTIYTCILVLIIVLEEYLIRLDVSQPPTQIILHLDFPKQQKSRQSISSTSESPC